MKSEDTVADVKKTIESTQGSAVYPATQLMLIHQGKVLKDGTTLEENKVAENSFVVVMMTKSKGPSGEGSTESNAPTVKVPQTSAPPASTPVPTTPQPPALASEPAAAPAPALAAALAPAPAATDVSDVYGHAASNLVAGNNLEGAIQMEADLQWYNAAAGSTAGIATATFTHPLDVVRTRFQVNDGRLSNIPTYKNTPHAVFTIARSEGFRGLYAGFYPAVLGSTISWGLYFYFYNLAKQRYLRSREELSPVLHLAAAAEAGGLVCLCTNPIWLVKTRMQLQPPHHAHPYSGFHDAVITILKEEGWRALYKGLVPSLFLVTHGAIQFTVYEELRKMLIKFRTEVNDRSSNIADNTLDSFDYAVLGASSKLAAVSLTYPSQVIRARLQQRPDIKGIPRYMDSLHVLKDTMRFEGVRGFYRGITANVLKNAPAASITFIVYENVLNMLKLRRKD